MKKQIRKILEEIINKKWKDFYVEGETVSGWDIDKIEISCPKEEKFGDFSTNVAMVMGNIMKKSPMEIADKIAESLNKKNTKDGYIDKAEAAAPGYINFYMSKKYFIDGLKKVLSEKDEWGKIDVLKNKKYIFEHSSPNLFKPFHIGHLVNNSIGESLVRILKKSGANVKTISFPSDVSPGIAKTVWAIKEKGWENEMTIEKIGEAYVFGTAQYKENEDAKKEIDEINKKIYLSEDSEEKNIYIKGKELSLDYFRKITERLSSVFDELIFESEAESVGKEEVEKNIGKVFEKSDGAVIFPGSKYGLFDNVFINSQGFGTYLAKDIGLLKIKFDKFKFDESITITDVEQREHFQLVEKAAELINKQWADKSKFIQHGRLNFAAGKISSRYGNVPLAEDLIENIKERVMKKIEGHDMEISDKEQIAEKVSIGAIKYSVLKSSAGKNIVFDFEKSIAFEGDSGPYLQYSYVRAKSILRNVENVQDVEDVQDVENIPAVGKTVLKFPEAVKLSLENYSPSYVANFLFQLASEFNSFYAHTKVLDENNPDYKYNLALTEAVAETLKIGLDLLGIKTAEKM